MADEPKAEEKKPNFLSKIFSGQGGLLGGILEKVGVRGLMYQVGGRKAVAFGGALAFMSQVVTTEMGDWAKVGCCAAAAVAAAALMFSISLEDSKKNAK